MSCYLGSVSVWYGFDCGFPKAALDGYPYAYVTEHDHHDWQYFKPSKVKEDELPDCMLVYDECFTDNGAPFTHASDLFKHIAFKNHQCGDCGAYRDHSFP